MPASGYAVIDVVTGKVNGIVITNPGTYAAGDTPTITLSGGGGSIAPFTTAALSSNNVSGGLTKIGGGTLTLSGANTYTGGTTVTGGTLALGANNALASTGNVNVIGGIFDVVTFTNTVGTVALDNGGTINGSTGVLTSNDFQLRSGTVSAILAGAGTFTKTTAGTVNLSGANTFTGPINVNGGLVAFASTPPLFSTPGPLGTNANINLNGGGISYTGSTTNALNKVVAIGTSNGTIDVANSLGVLTIASVTSSGGNLIKTGPGTAQIAGTTALGSSGVTVSNGILQAGFGTNGIATLTVGAAGNMNFANSAIEALTLGNTAGALLLNGGAKLGFELNGATSDSVAVATGGTAVTGGVITLNFFNFGAGVGPGTYTLLTADSGLSGASYSLGAAPNGFNYTINVSDTLVSLTTAAYTPIYWRGGQNLSWNTLGTATANWTTDSAGTVDATSGPGTGDTVVFTATGAPMVATTITTTLDAAFAIDSLQFTNVPTGITLVRIDAGTSGSLTVAPLSSSGGIAILTGGGNVKITAPLTAGINGISPFNNSQTWNVVDAGSTLELSGNVTFTAKVTKTGAGVLTLGGNNSGAGAITLAAGALNINSATALGSGALSIASGTTIDSTVAATTLTTVNAQNWNGSFTFTGTQDLNLGTGAVAMSNSLTLTTGTANKSLTVGGAISGSGISLTKAGPGILVLNGNNSYTGLTTVSAGTLTLGGNNTTTGGLTLTAGTLNINNSGALGTSGTLTINGGTIDNISGSPITINNPLTVNSSFTFTGTNALNLSNGALTLNVTPTITTVGSNLTMSGSVSGVGNGMTKAGAGTLTLSGNNTFTGNVVVNAGTLTLSGSNVYSGTTTVTGTLNVSGSLSNATLGSITVNAASTLNVTGTISGNPLATALIYGATAGNSVVNVSNTMTLFATRGATIAGAVAVYNQTAGNVTVTPNTTTGTQGVAVTTGAYGYFNITGGTYRDSTGTTGGSRFTMTNQGSAAVMNTNGTINVTSAGTGVQTAVVFVGGTGFIDHTNAEWWLNYSLGQITVADSGKIDHTGSNQPFAIFMNHTANVTGGGYGVLNVAGANAQVIIGAQSIRFGNSTTATNGEGQSGFVNLAAGTLSVGAAMSTSLPTTPSPAVPNNIYTSFAGGTLKASANITNWNLITSGVSYNASTTLYGAIDNSAINTPTNYNAPSFTGGVTIDTNGFTLQLNAITGASGAQVRQADLTVTGGSGYVGAPAVLFSSVGVVSGGSPATGYALISNGAVVGIVITNPGTYTAGTVPTVSLIGGGGTGAAVTLTALNTSIVSGGLTKIGAGTLTLQGTNSYAGNTAISTGTLSLGGGGTNGSLALTSLISIASNAFFQINRSNAVAQGTDFTATALSGLGGLIQAGAGTTTLTTDNTYAGTTTISAGVLQLGSGGTTGTFGAGAVTNNGSLVYNRTNTLTLTSTNTITGTGSITLNSGKLVAGTAADISLTGGLTIGSAAGATVTADLDLSNANATFGAAIVQTNAAATNTITIGNTKVMTLNSGLTVGYAASAGTATTTILTTAGTGSLVVNGTSIIVGVDITGTANSAWFNKATLDVSNLSSFSTNVTNFNLGSGSLSAPTGTVLLSNTANTILATTLTVSNTGGNNGNGASTLTLGTGTNILRVDTIQIGRGKGSGPGFVQFASQATGSAGTVTITNKAGSGAANIDIGNLNGTATAGGAVGTLDLRGHTSTVTAGTVTMANNNNTSTGTTTATINFDTGTFTVTTLNMAPKTAAGVALASRVNAHNW